MIAMVGRSEGASGHQVLAFVRRYFRVSVSSELPPMSSSPSCTITKIRLAIVIIVIVCSVFFPIVAEGHMSCTRSTSLSSGCNARGLEYLPQTGSREKLENLLLGYCTAAKGEHISRLHMGNGNSLLCAVCWNSDGGPGLVSSVQSIPHSFGETYL